VAKKRANARTHHRRAANTRHVRATSNKRNSHRRQGSPNARVIVVRPAHNRRRKNRRNPMLGTSNVPGTKLFMYLLVGAIGAGLNKVVTNILPSSVTGSTLGRTVSAAAVAGAQWYFGSMVNREYGPFFGFGGGMNVVSEALTAYVPGASALGLSGRGVGDFVPASFTVPQNPILDASGLPVQGSLGPAAYPAAYATAG
jgi:hypothetical protein